MTPFPQSDGCFKRLIYQWAIRRIANRDKQVRGLSRRSAMVFSPHFDDETLGCGGTIIKKVKAGSTIHLVFMTDGTTSHRHLIPEAKLGRMRSTEGVNAARCLGVVRDHVMLLGLGEGRLASHRRAAVEKVVELIADFEPEEVFIPHRKEPLLWSSDHLETFWIVQEALRKTKRTPVVYEYPIWYWYHWPWVGFETSRSGNSGAIFRNTLACRFGLSLPGDFNHCIPIREVLSEKLHALKQHKTQMTRIIPESSWTTLGDVSHGKFLRCFFRDFEIFNRTNNQP